jgi:hypothetical protein
VLIFRLVEDALSARDARGDAGSGCQRFNYTIAAFIAAIRLLVMDGDAEGVWICVT